MADFILLMHDDAPHDPTPEMWGVYIAALNERGVLDGGSAIGGGETLRQGEPAAPLSRHIGGYIRVQAADLAAAKALVAGNPVFECGGTVEVRELPRS